MRLQSRSLNILVVEDNDGDYLLFETYLQQTNVTVNRLIHASSLSAISVEEEDIDIAFLDLSLPDSGGIESFTSLNQRFPRVPIVVLSGLADEAVALQCITLGAQDYLMKGELNERFLEKSINYSIERKKNIEEVLAVNAQYELIGSVTNDVIWNWDLDTNAVTCAKKSFLGYHDDAISPTLDWWIDRLHPDDKAQVVEALRTVMERRSASLQIEYRFRSGEGNYQYLYSRGTLLPAKGGESKRMIGTIMDVTERKKLEEKLLQSQLNVQRQMTEAMILGQEKQKEEIGKELHDNINQVLASVKLYMETAMTNPAMKDDMIIRSRNNVVYAINEIRKLSHSLVPPSLGDHGLTDAIQELVFELNSVGVFDVVLSIDGFEESLLENTTKLMVYRIIQEQVNNIIKYAKAKHVWIRLETRENRVMLSVKDDGIGFDREKKQKGIGLKNIESRVAYYAGTVRLETAPGTGTQLDISIPV